jgi:hypothetical protein
VWSSSSAGNSPPGTAGPAAGRAAQERPARRLPARLAVPVPGEQHQRSPATGRTGRWPLHVTAAERAFKAAVRRCGTQKRATCHTLRHSFATETLRGGCDIRTLQQVMGHRDIRTTTIYLHVVQQTGLHIRSPLDRPHDYEDFGGDILPALLPGEEGGRPAGREQPGESGQTVGNSAARRRRQPLA